MFEKFAQLDHSDSQNARGERQSPHLPQFCFIKTWFFILPFHTREKREKKEPFSF